MHRQLQIDLLSHHFLISKQSLKRSRSLSDCGIRTDASARRNLFAALLLVTFVRPCRQIQLVAHSFAANTDHFHASDKNLVITWPHFVPICSLATEDVFGLFFLPLFARCSNERIAVRNIRHRALVLYFVVGQWLICSHLKWQKIGNLSITWDNPWLAMNPTSDLFLSMTLFNKIVLFTFKFYICFGWN